MSNFQLFEDRLRWRVEGENYVRFFTFNSGDHWLDSRIPPAKFSQLQDYYLQAESTLNLSSENGLVIIPLQGFFRAKTMEEHTIYPENVLLIPPSTACELTNTDNETSRILIIEITGIDSEEVKPFSLLTRNQFTRLITASQIEISLGLFDSRAKFNQELKGNHAFLQNLNGAFEVEDRLLEMNDGILCSFLPKLEGEALAHNALLLLIDC